MTAADKMAQAIRVEPTELIAKWRVLELIAECGAEQAAAPKAEAVAEVYRAHYGGRARNIGFDSVRSLQGVSLPPPGTKLYAAPQPPAEREPLTWTEFLSVVREEFGDEYDEGQTENVSDQEREDMMRVVRMVERAHGIGTK